MEPSIYVEESSRSLRELVKEHHRDYAKKGEDIHKLKHWAGSHPDSARPSFNMYVVGAYKSCIDRPIGEAVRIQMRGNTLNSVGVYNRCKLTCLAVDTEWDNWSIKVAKEKANNLAEEGKDTLEQVPEERGEKRQQEKESHPLPKRRKIETADRSIWGEKAVVMELFLNQDSKLVARRMRQAMIQPLIECNLIAKLCSGESWLMS